MHFSYSMYGSAMGSLKLIGSKGNVFWSKYGQQGPGWHPTNVTVYGKIYKVINSMSWIPKLLTELLLSTHTTTATTSAVAVATAAITCLFYCCCCYYCCY